MKNLEALFPAIKKCTYVNTPAVGLFSTEVYKFRERQYKGLLEEGSDFFEKYAGMQAEVREAIARVYRGKPGYVALAPAFSYGFNAILEGIKKGARVLLLKNDYPSINWAVEARDFKIAYAEIDENLEDHIWEAFKQAPPEVFIFSIVQYLNGIKLDLDFLKALKEAYPDTLMIGDGTQYLGMERFNFETSGLDVLGASAYKWIGAGFGNGFFMFKEELEDRIVPKHMGFGSTVGKYKEGGDTLIGKFEGNHLDNSNIGSIIVGLEVQEKIGLEEIEKQVDKLSREAKEAFTEYNLLEESVVGRKKHSAIFNLKGDQALYDKLIRHNIKCAQRGEGIRVGFHFYNTMADLERVLAFL